MKKVVFLVMVAVMPFISCSSDDDTPQEPVIDFIVGKWYQIQETQIVNGVEKTSPMTACEKMDNFDIKNDGTITSNFYYDDENNECQVDGSEKINWVITSEGAYTFTYIEDDNYTTEVKLEGETLTETHSYTTGDYKVQDINVYSMTADTSGDDEGVYQEDPIIGKWKTLSEVKQSIVDGKVIKEQSYPIENENDGTEFKADGTFIEIYGGDQNTGVYEVNGDILRGKYDDDDEYFENEISIEANILTQIVVDSEYTNGNGKVQKDIFIYTNSRIE